MLAERIRLLRKERKLTMKQLGERIGVSESAVSQYESGGRSPDVDKLTQLARVLGCTTDYLVGNVDSPYMISTPELKALGIEWVELVSAAVKDGLSPQDVQTVIEAVKKIRPKDV